MKKYYITLAVIIIFASVLNFWDCYRRHNLLDKNTNTMQNENAALGYKVLNKDVKIFPVSHASFVITWGEQTIYVDPVGGSDLYKDFPRADVVLVTHSHPDHFDQKTLEGVLFDSILVLTQDAKSKFVGEMKDVGLVMKNGETKDVAELKISATPAYNIKPEQQQFHPKGRDNGYIIEKDGFRVYIAGDTSGTPEMRALKDIDIAFVPMNLPYTMTVAEAASTTLEFKPKQVWPYHYREKDGFSDVQKFKELINKANPNIEVVLSEWY